MNILCRISFIVGLLCLIQISASAQDAYTQQLIQSLEKTPANQRRIMMLNQLGERLRTHDPKSALKYDEEALKISKNLNYAPGIANSEKGIGLDYYQRNRLKKAIIHLTNSIPLFTAMNDENNLIEVYEMLSRIYGQQGQTEEVKKYQDLFLSLKNEEIEAQMEEEISEMEEEFKSHELPDFKAQEEALAKAEFEKEEALKKIEALEEINLRKQLRIEQIAHEAIELEKSAIKKELEIARQKRQTTNLLLIGFATLLLGLGGWFWYRSRQQKKIAALERERAEKLEQIDQLKDQFLANTSHELRTPLNGIIGLAESLHDIAESGSPQKRRENLELIIASGKRLSNLVNDLLDFSMIRNGELHLNPRPVDLRSITEIVLKINQALAKGKDLELVDWVPEDLPAIHGDEDRIMQILYNLVGNAIKFTQTGTVAVHAVDKEDFIEFSVSDTGIGVPQEKLESIFQAFVQADGSIQRQYAGTGLGLSITKHLVELMGGKIWAESQVGEGSTFFVTLPKSTEKASIQLSNSFVGKAIETESKRTTPSIPSSKENFVLASENEQNFRILIADDEPVNLQVLLNHLADFPYQITTAINGEDAIQIIDSHPPFDLVLLDVMMPQISGFKVCQHIREKHLPSELPVIMITAKNQVDDLVEGLSYGANDYLVKPFSKDELIARIKTHLNIHKISQATAKFVPNEFLHSLGYDTITDVNLGDQVEREVTVFFSDIRAYTTLAENMTPAENFKFVNAFAGRMGPIIQQNGGFVNQYLGDGIMAIFQKSPDDAVKAAVDMQRAIIEYNIERKAHNRQSIKVGMGLHTGSLIMGIIGDDLRTDAATISDTVNTASRMEGLTKFYGANLLVSESTLNLLSNPSKFNYRYLGRVQVKGKKQSVGVYDFFDGDSASEMTLKWANMQRFSEGVDAYFKKNFAEAMEAFQEVIAIHPSDSVAENYLKRAKHNLTRGVSETWDGIETMEFK